MVDVISNRVQELYGSFKYPGGYFQNEKPEENQTSYNTLKRFGEKIRRKKVVEKEQDKKVIFNKLFAEILPIVLGLLINNCQFDCFFAQNMFSGRFVTNYNKKFIFLNFLSVPESITIFLNFQIC